MTNSTQPITEALVDQLRARAAVGLEKYGVTLDRQDIDIEGWLQHMLEEMLDGAGYAMAGMRKASGLTAALSNLIEAVENTVEIPEPHCSCHLTPPCSDCVEWSLLREALSAAKAAIAMPKADPSFADKPATVQLAASQQPQAELKAVADMRDAYEGARECLLDWKGRAQRAEAELRRLGYSGIDASERPKPAEGGAVAWIRFCSDGGWEGPIHDREMDDIRRRSGKWTPLGVIAPAAATRAEDARPAPKPVPKCLRCGALTDLVCGSAECGNRNPSAMNLEK